MALTSAVQCQMKESESRFLSYLKPWLILVCLVGIELNPFVKLTRKQKFCKAVTEFFMFFLNVFFNLMFISLLIQPLIEHGRVLQLGEYESSASNSALWNVIIEYFSFTVLSIGGHAALLNLLLKKEWQLLWKSLEQMTEELHPSEAFQSSCHRAVISGIVLLFVVRIC